ncbi:M28 family peptidase [Pedobacter helvus]|uniref:M28 family peptidase n=1 Tax=Pedobacter helvus TaxID=2563444 RepID=A0ABW9JDP8_9SPHI|nr:M28 family peptidase [Pedobacter ureilyticus]
MMKILTFLWLSLFSFYCAANTDTTAIKKHLKSITKTASYRNPENLNQLNAIADYIKKDFLKYSGKVSFQEYKVEGKTYKNVVCSFGTENQQRIIVGAHYDVCGDQEGADDNASGVVGLLELARLLKGQKLNKRIDLVAFTLEEPPYFRTEHMGSYVHAKSLKNNKVDVLGMISVEMIGYFSDKENSQNYPVAAMSKMYGNKGDYITLVSTNEKGKFVEEFSQHFKQAKAVKTEEFNAPRSLPGIDFSDHLNYWDFGYSAMMITDTSFYRNKNYHKKTDTMETLDIRRMAKVIDGIYIALLKLTKK